MVHKVFLHRYYRKHRSLQRGAWHSAPEGCITAGQWKFNWTFTLLKTTESYRQLWALLTLPAPFQMITPCGDKFSQHLASQSAQNTELPASQHWLWEAWASPGAVRPQHNMNGRQELCHPSIAWTDPQVLCKNQAQILLANRSCMCKLSMPLEKVHTNTY